MPRINMNDNVDRMFLDYLDRLDAADETYREWTQVRRGDLSDAFKAVVRNFAGIAVDAESGEERPMMPDEAGHQ